MLLPGRSSLCLLLVVAACAEQAAVGGDGADSPAAAVATDLVDSTISPAIAGREGWDFQQSATHDFDGDGQAERVVLTAHVALMRGRPAWDDGQQWQVYVEEPDSTRTYIYAQFVQLGTVTLRVGEAADGGRASIVLIEHLPDRLGVYETDYQAPGRFSTTQRFVRTLDPRGDIASPKLP
jgi:hypothetical protein